MLLALCIIYFTTLQTVANDRRDGVESVRGRPTHSGLGTPGRVSLCWSAAYSMVLQLSFFELEIELLRS